MAYDRDAVDTKHRYSPDLFVVHILERLAHRTVESLGASVVAERIYPDHHPFAEAEVDEALSSLGPAGCDWVLTTEKDAVRLPPGRAGDPRLRVLRVEAEVVAGRPVLDAMLAGALAGHPVAASPTTSTSTPIATQPPGGSPVRRLLLALGALVGWLGWALHVRRRVVLGNLRLAFPEKSEAERRTIARRAFVTLGRNMGEFLALPRLSRQELEGLFVYDPGAWGRADTDQALPGSGPFLAGDRGFDPADPVSTAYGLPSG